MYVRKTRDEYVVQGLYDGSWEDLTYEDSYKEARNMLKCYNENELNYSHRIIKRRIKL